MYIFKFSKYCKRATYIIILTDFCSRVSSLILYKLKIIINLIKLYLLMVEI